MCRLLHLLEYMLIFGGMSKITVLNTFIQVTTIFETEF